MGKKISLDEAATELGVSKRTIRRLVSFGVLRAYQLPRTKVIRLDLDDVLKALQPTVLNDKR
jgi:excisionase family DNA binding protein